MQKKLTSIKIKAKEVQAQLHGGGSIGGHKSLIFLQKKKATLWQGRTEMAEPDIRKFRN